MFCVKRSGVKPLLPKLAWPKLEMVIYPMAVPGTKLYRGLLIRLGDCSFTQLRLKENRAVLSRVGEKICVSDKVEYWPRLSSSTKKVGKEIIGAWDEFSIV